MRLIRSRSIWSEETVHPQPNPETHEQGNLRPAHLISFMDAVWQAGLLPYMHAYKHQRKHGSMHLQQVRLPLLGRYKGARGSLSGGHAPAHSRSGISAETACSQPPVSAPLVTAITVGQHGKGLSRVFASVQPRAARKLPDCLLALDGQPPLYCWAPCLQCADRLTSASTLTSPSQGSSRSQSAAAATAGGPTAAATQLCLAHPHT